MYTSQTLTFESDKITTPSNTEVMMDWEHPLMSASAAYVTENGGDILEIGFGMGISAGYIHSHSIDSHTIVENHPQIIPKAVEWASNKSNVVIISQSWYDVKDSLGTFNGVFYDSFGDDNWLMFSSSLSGFVKSGTKLTFYNKCQSETNDLNIPNCQYEQISVTIDENKILHAKTIIISTGASAKYLGLPSEKRLIGGGVSACAVCDGFFYKNQEVAIVGGGDTAAEEATYLANICSKVTMIIRRNEMRASKAMQHRVNKTKNIEIMYETEISEVLGDKVVEAVEVISNKTKIKSKIIVSGLFIAIGHKPNTEIFQGQLEMDDLGYILTKGKSTKTNKPGVFASGDVQDNEYRQAVTAAGTGCMAALDAERYIGSL